MTVQSRYIVTSQSIICQLAMPLSNKPALLQYSSAARMLGQCRRRISQARAISSGPANQNAVVLSSGS